MRLNPFRRRSRRGAERSRLSPEAKRAIVGIVLLTFALMVALSIFGLAGQGGVLIVKSLRLVIGWLAYPAPLVVAYLGWRSIRPRADVAERSAVRTIGILVACTGLLGVFHVIGVPAAESLQVAYEGKGGGLLGFALSFPLSWFTSRLVSGLLFSAATIIGTIMAADITTADAAAWFARITKRGAARADEHDTLEDSDEGVPTPRFSISRMKSAVDPAQLSLTEKEAQREQQQQALQQTQIVKAANKRYTPPPLELFESSSREAEPGDTAGNKEIIKDTLAHFGITVHPVGFNTGPTVTQYTLRPEEGVRLSQITVLQNDLARALKAHPVRIEAPIPGTDLVGIEIPNQTVALVRLREMFNSKEIRQAKSPLTVALGKDVAGQVVAADLDRMPHLLIAGATNSGKSVAIHSLLMSLLRRNSPRLLRLVLVDPKRVELMAYNGLPHLWGEPVIVDTIKTLNALKWALSEMDRRYKLLAEAGSRNLMSYNVSHPNDAQPFIVIVIDELADLMAKHGREIEGPVVRLSQLARAVGIHLVLATQRPSVNVITGLIKANIPSRIAFKVASQVDSRTILDMAGAEKLLGTGDMLYSATDNTQARRLQGGFVSEREVRDVVSYIIEHNPGEEYQAEESITESAVADSGGGGDLGDDPLFEEAKRLAQQYGKVSTSLLQRRLRVGYSRGARLVDMLEEHGIISKQEGNKPRTVLVDEAEATEFAIEDKGDNEAEADEESTPSSSAEQESW